MSTRTVHDPFLGKDVEVSNNLTDRLRGRYAMGPVMPNGEPEFGWRQFETPAIQHEAADEIDRLRTGWLKRIKIENDCRSYHSDRPCRFEQCACLLEMQSYIDEAANADQSQGGAG